MHEVLTSELRESTSLNVGDAAHGVLSQMT